MPAKRLPKKSWRYLPSSSSESESEDNTVQSQQTKGSVAGTAASVAQSATADTATQPQWMGLLTQTLDHMNKGFDTINNAIAKQAVQINQLQDIQENQRPPPQQLFPLGEKYKSAAATSGAKPTTFKSISAGGKAKTSSTTTTVVKKPVAPQSRVKENLPPNSKSVAKPPLQTGTSKSTVGVSQGPGIIKKPVTVSVLIDPVVACLKRKRSDSANLYPGDSVDSDMEIRMADLAMAMEVPDTPPRPKKDPPAIVMEVPETPPRPRKEPKTDTIDPELHRLAAESETRTAAVAAAKAGPPQEAKAGYNAAKMASGKRIPTRPDKIVSGARKIMPHSRAASSANVDTTAAAREWAASYEYDRSSETPLFISTPNSIKGKYYGIQGHLRYDGRHNTPVINLITGQKNQAGEVRRISKFPVPATGLYKILLSDTLNKTMAALEAIGPMVLECKLRMPALKLDEAYEPE